MEDVLKKSIFITLITDNLFKGYKESQINAIVSVKCRSISNVLRKPYESTGEAYNQSHFVCLIDFSYLHCTCD